MATPSRRPNIIIYCTDQQRADLLGCMGHSQIRTPNIDALARRGVTLGNFHIQGTVCMPSRYSILTGQYPSTHGVVANGFERPFDTPTLASMLAGHGYRTAAVGRTHLRCSIPHPMLPRENYFGFQQCHHTQCYWEGLDPHGEYLQWIIRNHPDRYDEAATPRPVNRNDAMGASWTTLEDDKTMTAWVTTQSLNVLRQYRASGDQRPLFMWAGTWDPHSRFMVPSPWDRMYPPASIPLPVRRPGEHDDLPPHYRRTARMTWHDQSQNLDDIIRNTLSIYWGMISHVDDQFGRLMRGLDELRMTDNTIVVFMSDHGEMGGDHWHWAKGPYWFDGALRVPGVIAAPGRLPAGRRSDALVETIDLAPTLLEMAGAAAPTSLQGRSCLPLLEGKSERHRDDVFTEHHDDGEYGGEHMCSIRTATHRIVHYAERPYGELYDLQADPHALHNLWNRPEHVAIQRELQERLLNRLIGVMARPDQRVARW